MSKSKYSKGIQRTEGHFVHEVKSWKYLLLINRYANIPQLSKQAWYLNLSFLFWFTFHYEQSISHNFCSIEIRGGYKICWQETCVFVNTQEDTKSIGKIPKYSTCDYLTLKDKGSEHPILLELQIPW